MARMKDSIKNKMIKNQNQNQTKYFSTIRHGFFLVKIFTIHETPPKGPQNRMEISTAVTDERKYDELCAFNRKMWDLKYLKKYIPFGKNSKHWKIIVFPIALVDYKWTTGFVSKGKSCVGFAI